MPINTAWDDRKAGEVLRREVGEGLAQKYLDLGGIDIIDMAVEAYVEHWRNADRSLPDNEIRRRAMSDALLAAAKWLAP